MNPVIAKRREANALIVLAISAIALAFTAVATDSIPATWLPPTLLLGALTAWGLVMLSKDSSQQADEIERREQARTAHAQPRFVAAFVQAFVDAVARNPGGITAMYGTDLHTSRMVLVIVVPDATEAVHWNCMDAIEAMKQQFPSSCLDFAVIADPNATPICMPGWHTLWPEVSP